MFDNVKNHLAKFSDTLKLFDLSQRLYTPCENAAQC
jgi:hypothetical protein